MSEQNPYAAPKAGLEPPVRGGRGRLLRKRRRLIAGLALAVALLGAVNFFGRALIVPGSAMGLLITAGLLFLVFWISAEILHKAGFPRWYAIFLVIPITAVIGWLVIALIEWPIHRELAWLRFRAGDASEEGVALVEGYAIDLERRGNWKGAVEVYEELASRAPTTEGREYYKNSSRRHYERMGEAETT